MSLRHDDTARTRQLLADVARLTDAELIARLEDVARCSRRVTVEMLAHLAELDRRKLHRGEGCGKLFPYCTQVLKLSEAAAWNRIKAARAARRFPVILEMLAEGAVNLTTIRLLSPHLTAEISATGTPRASRGVKPGSRHVPAIVRRVVWERDGGRCAFVRHKWAAVLRAQPPRVSPRRAVCDRRRADGREHRPALP